MPPKELLGTEIKLRPMRYRDRKQWNRVRVENREWLTPWEATLPKIPVGNPAHESGDQDLLFMKWSEISRMRREQVAHIHF